jgi:hypothetical protein
MEKALKLLQIKKTVQYSGIQNSKEYKYYPLSPYFFVFKFHLTFEFEKVKHEFREISIKIAGKCNK